jgi:hypothetical protein
MLSINKKPAEGGFRGHFLQFPGPTLNATSSLTQKLAFLKSLCGLAFAEQEDNLAQNPANLHSFWDISGKVVVTTPNKKDKELAKANAAASTFIKKAMQVPDYAIKFILLVSQEPKAWKLSIGHFSIKTKRKIWCI